MKIESSNKIYKGNDLITTIYKGGEAIYSSLPYTKLNYLESTGAGQWINTNITPLLNTKIEIKYQFTNNTSNNKTRIFGERRSWDDGFYLGTKDNYATPGTLLWPCFSNQYDFDGTPNTGIDLNPHVVTLDKDAFYVDGVLKKTIGATTAPTIYANIALFGALDESTRYPRYGIYKLYYCKIWNRDTLVRDLIPVLDENNVPCLYDKANDQYYYNLGSGTFLYG